MIRKYVCWRLSFVFRQFCFCLSSEGDKCMLSWFSFFPAIYLFGEFPWMLRMWNVPKHSGKGRLCLMKSSIVYLNGEVIKKIWFWWDCMPTPFGSPAWTPPSPKDCSVLLQAVQPWHSILSRGHSRHGLEIKTAVIKYPGDPFCGGWRALTWMIWVNCWHRPQLKCPKACSLDRYSLGENVMWAFANQLRGQWSWTAS